MADVLGNWLHLGETLNLENADFDNENLANDKLDNTELNNDN